MSFGTGILAEGLSSDPWALPDGVTFSSSSDGEGSITSEESSSDESEISSRTRSRLERLDREDYGPSDSDDDSDVLIRTGDEVVPITTGALQEHNRSLVYSRETLMSLIPETPGFDRVREDLRIQKTEFKYSLRQSNKAFERDYYREHGRAPDKCLKKHKVVYKGDELDRFYGRHHPFSKRMVFRTIRNKPRREPRPLWKPTASEVRDLLSPLIGEKVSLPKEKPKSDIAQISRIRVERDYIVVNEIGGISYALKSSKVSATKWYRERRGQPFFYNSFGVIRAMRREGILMDEPP